MKKSTLTVLASLFIIVGIILTLENYGIVEGISNIWPIIPFLLGIGFVILFFNYKRIDPALIWIGTFLPFLSLFFYYLNHTSWDRLTYLWPIFLAIVGLSFLMTSVFTKKRLFLFLAVVFVTIFLALFLVFTISLRLWPISLVLFGLSLFIIEFFPAERFKKKTAKK